MGVERFFNFVKVSSVANFSGKFTHNVEKERILSDTLYVDFNSIIHVVSAKVVSNLNSRLYSIICGDTVLNNKLIDRYDLGTTHQSFSKKANKTINTMVIDNVLDNLCEVINMFDLDALKLIYIAIDGSPSKAKMMEQKRRRHIRDIIFKLKADIFEKHKGEMDSRRMLFEKGKVEFCKAEIGPSTEFMFNLYERLTDSIFVTKIRNLCKNMTEYVCSGPYAGGEGEKKIIDCLKGEKLTGTRHTIYSPDADVMLFSLLISGGPPTTVSAMKNLSILRHNQQTKGHDLIDVTMMSKGLYDYVSSLCEAKFEQTKVIDDIVLILTFFGNDFLPKIESLDVRLDFDDVIKTYANFLSTEKKHLIYINETTKGEKRISKTALTTFIGVMSFGEDIRLRDNYFARNHSNHRILLKVFGTTHGGIVDKLSVFLTEVKDFMKSVETDRLPSVMKKWGGNNELTTLLTKLSDDKTPITVEKWYNYYAQHGTHPNLRLGTTNVIRKFNHLHEASVSKFLISSKMKPTSYDKEAYSIDHLIGKYQEKLNAQPLRLGATVLRDLQLNVENDQSSVDKYYKKFFDVNDGNLKTVIAEYLKGIYWVFDYYYNNVDPKLYTSLWHYPYWKAPLFKDMFKHLQEVGVDKNVLRDVRSSFIEEKDYFNTIEHMIYVSPKSVISKLAPEEYKQFVKKHEEKELKKTQGKINCIGALFLNKCYIQIVPTIDDEDFIKFFRQVKQSRQSLRLTGKLPDVEKIYKEEFSKKVEIGSLGKSHSFFHPATT